MSSNRVKLTKTYDERDERNKNRIQGYVPSDIYDWVERKVEEGVFASRSHAVTRALQILRSYMEGTLLK